MLAQFAPDASRDVLIAPFALTFIAVVLFWTSSRRDLRKIGGMQILGIVLGIVAAFFGARHLWKLWDPNLSSFYRAAMLGKNRLIASHYVALAVPLMALAGMVFVVVRQWRVDPEGDQD